MAKNVLAQLFAIVEQPPISKTDLETKIFEDNDDDALELLMFKFDESKIVKLRELINENGLRSISELEEHRCKLLEKKSAQDLLSLYGLEDSKIQLPSSYATLYKVKQIDKIMQDLSNQVGASEEKDTIDPKADLCALCAKFSAYLLGLQEFPSAKDIWECPGLEESAYLYSVVSVYRAIELIEKFIAAQPGDNSNITVAQDLRKHANAFFKQPEDLNNPKKVKRFNQNFLKTYVDTAKAHPVLKEPAVLMAVCNVLWTVLVVPPLLKAVMTGNPFWQSKEALLKKSLFKALPKVPEEKSAPSSEPIAGI